MKKAIMLTVFGTSTEAKITFDKLIPLVKAEYPDRDIFVPYTSGVIRNKLNKTLLEPILSPEEMLNKLKGEGYTDIAVISTLIFAGVEHDKLEATVKTFASNNKEINISYQPPILADERNILPVVETLSKHLLPNAANIVVSHGTHDGHPVEAVYLKVAEIVESLYPDTYLGSIEGIPDIDDALKRATDKGNVRFLVFMFVAGDHAENDIVSDDEDSLFSKTKAMGKTPSVAWVTVDGKERIASLGLDPDYIKILMEYYKNSPSLAKGWQLA
ncbi:MAG: sirohydrochlorin cobaltochelatase [Deferribacteraceae bacterium]|jgi:sirohydrochlorin cobaltochelatase|nr:sirohydrochlorin cobaltochelatase [Deferribacteraceae bacterium]